MQKIFTRKIFLFPIAFFTIIVLMSNSLGRGSIFGQTLTGAPGDSNTTCASAGCHSSGAFNPEGSLSVINPLGDTVQTYVPGETYDVTLTVSTTGNPEEFGFQMVALTETEEAATDWGSIGTNIQTFSRNGRTYLEHNAPSTSNQFKTQWTAPETPAGDITFYFSVNAVNGNGSPSGDGASNANFTLSEATTSATEFRAEETEFYPNPATDFITVRNIEKSFTLRIFNSKGKLVLTQYINEEQRINLAHLAAGVYYIRLGNGHRTSVQKIVKI